jgi:acyl-CoA reductase-like NAD-dependent aldehyde dehydrogenase
MPTRLPVLKTYKLFINGAFPRSESGRSIPVHDPSGAVLAHIAWASRKDLRDAVEAARAAQPKWAALTAYNRGQILYRMAEMLEGKREEFAEAIGWQDAPRRATRPAAAAREVAASVDRLIAFAGWADKFSQVLGCQNAVAGPYYNFTVPEATGVVGIVAPDEHPLLALVSLLAPPLCAGNAIVAIAGDTNPLPAAILGEVLATSDVPPGIVNILTGKRAELIPHLASHREVDAIAAASRPADQSKLLQLGAAENVKRVTIFDRAAEDWFDPAVCENPWTIEPFVEMKTIWHPSAT